MKIISKKETLWKVGEVLLVVAVFLLALKWLIPSLTSKEFREFVEGLGVLGPLIVISYIVLSHIFAPLSGTPAVLLGVAVFGVYQTMFYLYIASMISAVTNFWISRRFGRSWVTKLVGRKTMDEVDRSVEASGTKILILSRLLGFALFEVISYAAGLTRIRFKKYFFITLIFTIVPNSVFAYIFKGTDFSSKQGLLLWLGTIVIVGVIFSIFIKRLIKKRK